MTLRSCRKCNEEKDIEAFHTNGKNYRRHTCKECLKPVALENYYRNHEENKAKRAVIRKRTYKQGLAYRLKYRFGITIEDYERMLLEQEGVCKICQGPPTQIRLAIDHCHATNKIRGLLCHKCNTAIGLIKDDPNNALRMVEYLREHLV